MRDKQDDDASNFTITFKERMCGVKSFAPMIFFSDATKILDPQYFFKASLQSREWIVEVIGLI